MFNIQHVSFILIYYNSVAEIATGNKCQTDFKIITINQEYI